MSKLKTACRFPNCNQITEQPFCDIHTQQKNRERDTAAQRGYDTRWRKARLMYLRAHPLCHHCLDLGISTSATVVDHITPHRGNTELFWETDNWQPLCKSCHDRKTAGEDGGFGNLRK